MNIAYVRVSTIEQNEERQIINDGIQKLKNDAKTQEIIYQAYVSAKDIIEQYLVNMGKLVGEDYTVEWIKVPEESPTITTEPTSSTKE